MCRKLIYLVSFVLVLSLVGDVQAANLNWTDATGDHNWFTTGNWDLGRLPTTNDDQSIINLLPGPNIVTEGAVGHHLRVGTAAGSFGAVTINGGVLTLSGGLKLADDSSTGNGILTMKGGTLFYKETSHVGAKGSGTLIMTGGLITNVLSGDSFKIAEQSTGKGHVDLDGGIINVPEFKMRDNTGAVGTMDVEAGTLIIKDNRLSTVQPYIDKGWITAYGGSGYLHLDYNVTNLGKTTLTATGYRLNMQPANGAIVPYTLNQLQWTLPEPNQPEGVVTCVVWFGTNPDIESNPKIVDREAVESVTLPSLVVGKTYYWAIDLYDSSISDTEPFYLTPVFSFTVQNIPPVVNAGADVATWLADGESERVVQLDGAASDEDGPDPVTLLWTVTAEPNVLNPAQISDPTVADPTVTVKAVGTYTLKLAAYDGQLTSNDTMQIVLYANSCLHARNQPGFVRLVGDIYYDCKVNFLDLAGLAAEWLEENYSTE